jgi:hypothetical protein
MLMYWPTGSWLPNSISRTLLPITHIFRFWYWSASFRKRPRVITVFSKNRWSGCTPMMVNDERLLP